jgi:membrane protein DedA with SNARE-associated domain
MSVSHLIQAYGYFAVLLLVGAESLGIPVPGETALIVAGAYAGHTHRLSPWVVFVVASVAAIIGDNVGFWIGDRYGYRFIRKFGQHFWLDERKIKIARYVFDSHGPKVVFLGRFVSILRTYAAFLAGSSRMRWSRFLPANAAGGIVWAGFYTLVAYLAGNAITHMSGSIDAVIASAAILAVVAAVIVMGRQTSRLALRAEAAYPGPLE